MRITALIVFLFWLASCNQTENELSDYERGPMLENYADHFIIQGYESLINELENLDTILQNIQTNPSESEWKAAQNQWIDVVHTWEKVSMFNFGPAGEEGTKKSLIEEIATFPVDTVGLLTRLQNADLSTDHFVRDERGLFAMEYLLFGESFFYDHAIWEDDQHILFSKALLSDIKKRVSDVHAYWLSDYRATFINSTGTSVGSSTSLLYNEFVRSYEIYKNYKLSLPMGRLAGQSKSEPTKAEGYFSNQSISLAYTHFEALYHVWEGSVSENNQDGFKNYLSQIEGGDLLIASTMAQIDLIFQDFENIGIDQNMTSLIAQSTESLDELYEHSIAHTRYYKGDMASLLGISITFSSGDGD